MKKILYIQNAFSFGGINRVTSIKENYLARHGFEVHNFNVLNDDKVKAKFYDEQIHFHYIEESFLKKLLSIKIIGAFLRFVYFRYKYLTTYLQINPTYTIVTYENLEPFSIVLLTFWKKRIFELHGVQFDNKKNLRNWFRYNIKFKFYKLVVLTERDKEIKEKQTGNLCYVIPNPIPFISDVKSYLKDKNVTILSRICDQKGILEFIPHWKTIQEMHPDWNLLIYGDGSQKTEAVALAKKLNLTSISFFPFTDDVKNVYLNSSAFLLPSKFEGFPMCLLESMSYGVPCVAFDCDCGPSDIITNNVDGYVVKLFDYNSFINCIIDLINDEEMRKKMGEHAFDNIKRYSITKIMQNWVEIFNS